MGGMSHNECMDVGKSKDSVQELLRSLDCMSLGDRSQVSRLGGKHPPPLSHPKCPLESHSLICLMSNHCAGVQTCRGVLGTIWESWSSSIIWVPKMRLGSSDLGASSIHRVLYHLIALFGFGVSVLFWFFFSSYFFFFFQDRFSV